MSRPGLKQITAFMALFREQLAENISGHLGSINITRLGPFQARNQTKRVDKPSQYCSAPEPN